MNKNGFPGLHNYIDDLINCGLLVNIHKPYQFLMSLLQDLGLAISEKKLCPPSTKVVCLGILFDTTTRTMSIPPEKMFWISERCVQIGRIRELYQRMNSVPIGFLALYYKVCKVILIFLEQNASVAEGQL